MAYTRRSILGGVLAIPAGLSSLFRTDPSASKPDPNDPNWQFRFLAVQILRHINTVQALFYRNNGHYADTRGLLGSAELRTILNSKKAEEKGIGQTLFGRLSFEGQEIVAGWNYKLLLGEDSSSYHVEMWPAEQQTAPQFSTDESGIINQETPIGSSTSPVAEVRKSTITARARSVLQALAAVLPDYCRKCYCCFCTEYSCCGDPCCSCTTDCLHGNGCTGNLCYDCGCIGCPFVCC